MRSNVDQFAARLSRETGEAVAKATSGLVAKRREALARLPDPEAMRTRAAEIRDDVLDHLDGYLATFEAAARDRGIQVHYAIDADQACGVITALCEGADVAVKGKSMATEEIHLNEALASAGVRVVETDLGEFVLQVDGDAPSHIVAPIIHKSRKDVARSFHEHGLGPYSEDPATLAMQAREHLRREFQRADFGISGVNFACAKEGILCIVENEGNNRLSTTAPRKHIAVMGMEKLLPSTADLPLFLRLLAGSATGQRLTVYTHLILGPRQPDEPDGPEEVHVVVLDNGRRKLLQSRYRDILRCIRCGACLNVCPVYCQASGHGYRHTYSGPLGAVLVPSLFGVADWGDLAKASTLCGACEEVCPVKIPIPDLLLLLREEGHRSGVPAGIPWGAFVAAASHPSRWRTSLTLLPMATSLPSGWSLTHESPQRRGRDFRHWWKGHIDRREGA